MRLGLAVLLCAACTIDTPKPTYERGTFPYNPLVYELDLATFAYQLHAQSMVWPIDPFYEEHANPRSTSRDTFMRLVREWAARQGTGTAYRGPGVLAGVPDNPTHDPLLYDYARLHPWSDAISNNDGRWTEYKTPRAITRRIRDVYVAAQPIGGGNPIVTQIVPVRIDADPDAADLLCAFEGGTGDKGITGQPASYSLMGYVLARDTGGGSYDVHVAFRGSRSGSAERAVSGALSEAEAAGNPDWITDLGWDKIAVPELSTVGGIDRGFAYAAKYNVPNAYACLSLVAQVRGAAPTSIYVTGHSLGAALAQMFASAVTLGSTPVPDAVRAWPWAQLKLVTFSAPRAGDHAWASKLAAALESDIYDPGPIETVDADARTVLDPGIATRLLDVTRPVAFRVLISTDPVTTTHFVGDATHVGTTVYVNGASLIDWLGIVSGDDHEPINVRTDMTDAFDDPNIPATAWAYRELTDVVPDRDAGEAGTPSEMQKLATGLINYYSDRGMYFDAAAFTRDVELMFAIERGSAVAREPIPDRRER